MESQIDRAVADKAKELIDHEVDKTIDTLRNLRERMVDRIP